MEGAVVAEARQIELERLALHDPAARHVVDHEMREIRLSGQRAQRRESGHVKRTRYVASGCGLAASARAARARERAGTPVGRPSGVSPASQGLIGIGGLRPHTTSAGASAQGYAGSRAPPGTSRGRMPKRCRNPAQASCQHPVIRHPPGRPDATVSAISVVLRLQICRSCILGDARQLGQERFQPPAAQPSPAPHPSRGSSIPAAGPR